MYGHWFGGNKTAFTVSNQTANSSIASWDGAVTLWGSSKWVLTN